MDTTQTETAFDKLVEGASLLRTEAMFSAESVIHYLCSQIALGNGADHVLKSMETTLLSNTLDERQKRALQSQFGMFSTAGSELVREMLGGLVQLESTGASVKEAAKHMREHRQAIEKLGHREVYDTAVREEVAWFIEQFTGYKDVEALIYD